MATGNGTTGRKPAQRPAQEAKKAAPKTAPKPAPAPEPEALPDHPSAPIPSAMAPLIPMLAALLRPEEPTNTVEMMADLTEPFPMDAVEWRQQHVMRDGKKAMYVPYLSNRAVQDRLDTVCGVGGWQNTYRRGPGGGILCGISVRIVQGNGIAEWVTKWDGAENTAIEAVKGGLSDSMKRAAVEWGIGRYLYRVPKQWLRIDADKRRTQEPELPPAFLPKRKAGNVVAGISAERRKAEQAFHAVGTEWAGHAKEWDAQRPHVVAIFGAAQKPPLPLMDNSTGELSTEHVEKLTAMLRKKIESGQPPKKMLTTEGRDAAGRRGQPVEEPEPPVEDEYPLTAEEREEQEGQEWLGADVANGASAGYGDPGEMPDFLQ